MGKCKIVNRIKEMDRCKCRKILENLVLITFAIMITELFLKKTEFSINWPTDYHVIMRYVTIAIIALKLHFDEETRKIELVLLFAFVIIFQVSARISGYDELIDVLIFLVGLKGIDLTKVIKVFFSTIGILLLTTIIASQTGIIENLIYTWPADRRARMSFGIIYPTDFAAFFFFLSLAWIYIRKTSLMYIELIIIAASGVFVYYFCDARLSAGCIEITAIIFFFVKLRERYVAIYNKNDVIPKGVMLACVLIPIVCAVFIIFASYFYSGDIPILAKINSILSGRLNYGKMAFDNYNVTCWGQYVDLTGNGGTTLYYLKESNWFIDASYLNILFRFGIFVFFSFLIMMCGSLYKAEKMKDYYLTIIFVILSVQFMIEHHAIELWYNPFLFALFANLQRPVMKLQKGIVQ